MKKILLLVPVAVMALAAGCGKSVRYTQDEIKDFPSSVQEHIRNSEVTPGMTKMQVRYAWGGPHSVNVLSPSDDGKERVEWIYERFRYFRTHLIFTDGKVTEIISNEPGAPK